MSNDLRQRPDKDNALYSVVVLTLRGKDLSAAYPLSDAFSFSLPRE